MVIIGTPNGKKRFRIAIQCFVKQTGCCNYTYSEFDNIALHNEKLTNYELKNIITREIDNHIKKSMRKHGRKHTRKNNRNGKKNQRFKKTTRSKNIRRIRN